MLEIVALIYLTRSVGQLALNKGLKPGTWKLYTVLAWFAGEITGLIIGFTMFGVERPIMALFVASLVRLADITLSKQHLNENPMSLRMISIKLVII